MPGGPTLFRSILTYRKPEIITETVALLHLAVNDMNLTVYLNFIL